MLQHRLCQGESNAARVARLEDSLAAIMNEREHIVVCDDEPDLRDMVAEYLERQGFDVTQAGNGLELRERLTERAADAIVLDIAMPGEDGLSIARDLRSKSDVAIVMLTASGETVDRIVGLEMGADDYLATPVALRQLLAPLPPVLRRARPAAAAPSRAARRGPGRSSSRSSATSTHGSQVVDAKWCHSDSADRTGPAQAKKAPADQAAVFGRPQWLVRRYAPQAAHTRWVSMNSS